MADFEIIEDAAKAISKGKDMKKFIPFIVIGAGLGAVALIFGRNRQAAAQPITEGEGLETDLGGVMTDFANQTNEAIQKNNEEVSYQLSEITGNLVSMINEQNSIINQLQDQMNDNSNLYQSALSVQNVTATPQPENTSGFSIYFDGVDDDIQFNNTVRNAKKFVSEGKVSQSEADQIKREIAGLGNNGVGWTAENWKDNQERMRNDPSYVQSEIERAKLVIENRQAAGLSTAGQEKYLTSLQDGSAWTE